MDLLRKIFTPPPEPSMGGLVKELATGEPAKHNNAGGLASWIAFAMIVAIMIPMWKYALSFHPTTSAGVGVKLFFILIVGWGNLKLLLGAIVAIKNSATRR